MSIVTFSSGELSELLYQFIHPQKVCACAKQDFSELRVGLVQSYVAASHQLLK